MKPKLHNLIVKYLKAGASIKCIYTLVHKGIAFELITSITSSKEVKKLDDELGIWGDDLLSELYDDYNALGEEITVEFILQQNNILLECVIASADNGDFDIDNRHYKDEILTDEVLSIISNTLNLDDIDSEDIELNISYSYGRFEVFEVFHNSQNNKLEFTESNLALLMELVGSEISEWNSGNSSNAAANYEQLNTTVESSGDGYFDFTDYYKIKILLENPV